MVYTFLCELVSPPYIILMGADMYENDELIKWSWPEDVWFHVDKLSSAHVYLRLHDGETLDDIPEAVIQDCAQLCKQNSIQGCKQNDVTIIYTMWENLKKTASMDPGQVSFHDDRLVRQLKVEKRISEIIKRLDKTRKVLEKQNLREVREARDERVRQKEKAIQRAREKTEREAEKKRQSEVEKWSYDRLFAADKMRSNQDGYDSDDFM